MEIRVLQLADLLIRSKKDAVSYRDKLLNYYGQDVTERPHYIAVAGNLTRSGTAEEFQHVAVLLGDLSKLLLAPEEWRRRILVAPGPTDATRSTSGPGEPLSFEHFNEFYSKNFLESDYDNSLLPNHWHSKDGVHLAVRILPDFTSVAFFWDQQLHFDAKTANRDLWKQISDRHRSWSADQSMLLLSSCVPPAVAPEDYLSDAKVCTYLVGRTPHAMLKELRYNALSWTLTPPSPLMRGNIHSFRHRGNRIEHRGQTFDFSGEVSHRIAPAPGDDPPPENHSEPFGDLYRELTRNLMEDWAASGHRLPRLHIIRGVPGAGKNQFVGRLRAAALADLADSSTLQEKSVASRIQTIEFWQGETPLQLMNKKLEDACRRLGDRICRCKGRTEGVLLVFDHNEDMDGYADTGNQTQAPLNLFQLLRKSPPRTTPYPIVYLSNAENDLEDLLLTTSLTPNPGTTEMRSIVTYWLPLGNSNTLRTLMESYPSVPFQAEDIARLTGCLCGISKRLIDALASESGNTSFGNTRRQRWQSLIRLARESETLRNSFIRFERFLQKVMQATFDSVMDPELDVDLDVINECLFRIAKTLEDNPQATIPDELSQAVSEFMTHAKARFEEWGLSNPRLHDLPLLPYLVQ